MFGFLIINKPAGISSRTALDGIGRFVRPTKFGHAGTLDPMATGVLVACIGPATRLVSYVQDLPKEYTAKFRLGFESETEDTDSPLIPVAEAATVDRDHLASVLDSFVGTIEQLPPKYSALKVGGQRAYKLARQGEAFELKPRPIEIHQLQLSQFDFPDFELKIKCGSGTYVRSLGRDIGSAVNSGAVMTSLVRTSIGNFRIEDADRFDSSQRNLSADRIADAMLDPITGLAALSTVTLSETQIAGLINGVAVRFDKADLAPELAAVDSSERLMAVLQQQQNGEFTPKINFAHYWQSQTD